MKKAWVLSYLLSIQQRLIRLSRCPGRSESSLGAHAILFALSCADSNVFCLKIVIHKLIFAFRIKCEAINNVPSDVESIVGLILYPIY